MPPSSLTVGELEGRAEELFEGIAMLAAVCVLTWMIFWMRRQAVAIRGELEAKVAAAVAAGSALALASVVFFAVLREGWETALFLFAVTEGTSPLATGIGASLGLLVSVAPGSPSTVARTGSTCASSSPSPARS